MKGTNLVNVRSSIGGHVDDGLLRDLPDRLVDLLEVVGDAINLLDRTVVRNQVVLEVLIPQTQLEKVLEEVLVHELELASKDTARVDVGRERLDASVTSATLIDLWAIFLQFLLVEAKNLRCRGGGHGSKQKRVAHTVLSNLGLECSPIPQVGGGHVPHVVLQDTLAHGRTCVGLVRTFNLRELIGLHERQKKKKKKKSFN